jgi:type VI secretion system lysozyme-like protein
MDAHERIHVRKPLFDRLVESDFRADEGRTLDRAGLKQSVRRELEQLFNTRAPLPVHHLSSAQRSVVDYGIPELSTYSARNPDDRVLLGEMLRRAVSIYEPRLADVTVRVLPAPGDDLSLVARLEAVLFVEGVHEPVSFELQILMREGKVNFDAGA